MNSDRQHGRTTHTEDWDVSMKEHLKRLVLGSIAIGVITIFVVVAQWIWENYGGTLSLVATIVFVGGFAIFATYLFGMAISELWGDYRA